MLDIAKKKGGDDDGYDFVTSGHSNDKILFKKILNTTST